MKILVLGSTGFVGRNVSEFLKTCNVDFQTLAGKAQADLRKQVETKDFFDQVKPDVVINCAAHVGSLNYVTEKAADVIVDNSQMILNMYQAIASTNHHAIVINPIANCAYPAKSDTFLEDHWWDGHLHRSVLSYGSTRRLLWSVGESFAMQYGVRSINLLVPNMYGLFDSTDPNKAHALNALVSKFVKAEKNQAKDIEIWGTGIAIREWLYAKDFAKAVYLILQNPTMIGLSEPVNIAQNFGLSVRELVQIIHAHFGNKFKIKWNANMPDGAPKKVMDDNRFKKVFKQFQFTPIDEGVKQTVQYYQSIYPY
jgi:GDP-L-fucose synthase